MEETSTMDSTSSDEGLTFLFRGKNVPVTYPSMSREVALLALESDPFQTWSKRCEQENGQQRIEIHSVEIQSVDLFGAKRAGFVKIKADCTLVDGETHHEHRLPGICFLRGDSVAILIALICADENNKAYSLLVKQPRIPVGQVSVLELPAGMVDNANDSITGTATKEMEEECGIKIRPSDLVDMTELACQDAVRAGHLPHAGIPSSPGGCDELIRYMYAERIVSKRDLDQMRGRSQGLREHGEYITLQVVSMEEMWKVSGDGKAMCALFLAEQLRKEGKLPALGGLSKPISSPGTPVETTIEPHLEMANKLTVPQLAFGLYKVPADEEGEKIITDAIAAGYRHFDTAAYYGNEATLGRAIKKSGIPRQDFFLASKVWNDAQKEGRVGVRQSVEKSLTEMDCGGYFDLFYIHWPVPGYFTDTYKELQGLYKMGKILSIGLSNFGPEEYEVILHDKSITIPPAVNQIEISPYMYRPGIIKYFQDRNILMAASKALHRAVQLDSGIVKEIADSRSVAPAQVMLRWGLQKRLIVAAKTSNALRMQENRDVLCFSLTDHEMGLLDSLTTQEDIRKREVLEDERRKGM